MFLFIYLLLLLLLIFLQQITTENDNLGQKPEEKYLRTAPKFIKVGKYVKIYKINPYRTKLKEGIGGDLSLVDEIMNRIRSSPRSAIQ